MNAERALRWLDRLLIAELVGLTFLLGCFLDKEADIWWHLRAGRELLAGGGIPSIDQYIFAATGREWIDLHWGFQAIAALIFSRAGFIGLTWMAALTAAAAIAVALAATARHRSVMVVTWCWLPAVFVMSARFYPRPEIFSLVLLASVLWVLRAADAAPARLWLLVPIQIVWVNVHGLFVLGPIVLVCWLIERALRGELSREVVGWQHRRAAPLAVLLACLANPYGWKGAVFPLTLFQRMSTERDFYGQHIGELMSIPDLVWRTGISSVYLRLSFLLLAVTAASFAFRRVRRPFPAFRLLLFVAFATLGLLAIRNQPQFAIVAGTVLAWNVGDWLAARPLPSIVERAIARILTSAVLVGLMLWVATGRFYGYASEGRLVGVGEQPLWYAHEAAAFAARAEMPDHFIAYHEGQAAVLEFHMRPDQRVFVDARLEVSPREGLQQYYDLATSLAARDPNWPRHLPAASPVGFLVDHASHHAVEATLLTDARWRCIWFDAVAGVYVPSSEQALVSAHGVDFGRRYFQTIRNPKPAATASAAAASLAMAEHLFKVGRAVMGADPAHRPFGRLLMFPALAEARATMSHAPWSARVAQLVASASLSAYDYPDRDSVATNWDAGMVLGVARGRYFLNRALQQQPRDFQSWLALFGTAQALGDPDALWLAGGRVAELRATNAVEYEVQRQVRGVLRQLVVVRAAEPPLALPVGDAEVVAAVRDLIDRRRFFRALDLLERAIRDRAERVPSDLANLRGLLWLVSGDPARARVAWAGGASTSGPESAATRRTAATYFVEARLAEAAESYRVAIAAEPADPFAHHGLAVTLLELADAPGFRRECDAAQRSSTLPGNMIAFCRDMGEAVRPYVADATQRPADSPIRGVSR